MRRLSEPSATHRNRSINCPNVGARLRLSSISRSSLIQIGISMAGAGGGSRMMGYEPGHSRRTPSHAANPNPAGRPATVGRFASHQSRAEKFANPRRHPVDVGRDDARDVRAA